jgi:hypothetical protein
MKKFFLVLIIAVAVIVPAAAQLRIDVGLMKPLGVGLTDVPEANSLLDEVSSSMAQQIWLMLPEVGAYYEFNLNPLPLRFGVGARAFSFLVMGAAWPNAFCELQLGPVFVEAQLGGLLFGYYFLNEFGGDFGKVLIPDLSAWFAFGEKKSFRVGGGITMLYLPEFIEFLNENEIDRTIIPFIYYASAKFAIRP